MDQNVLKCKNQQLLFHNDRFVGKLNFYLNPIVEAAREKLFVPIHFYIEVPCQERHLPCYLIPVLLQTRAFRLTQMVTHFMILFSILEN